MDASKTYHHGDLSNAALRAAETLLQADGETGVSMREIAKRVGVTHRALYRWFPDRDAVLAALAAEGFARLGSKISEATTGRPLREAKPAFVRAFLEFSIRHRALYQLAMSRDRSALKRYPVLGAAAERLIAASLDVFGQIDAEPRDYVIALWSLLHGLTDLYSAGLLAIRDDDALADYGLMLSERLTLPKP
jgi:AcrR family transcriptional regulator